MYIILLINHTQQPEIQQKTVIRGPTLLQFAIIYDTESQWYFKNFPIISIDIKIKVTYVL